MACVSGWNGLLLRMAWRTRHNPVSPSADPASSPCPSWRPASWLRDTCPARPLCWDLSPPRQSLHGRCQLSPPPSHLDKEAGPSPAIHSPPRGHRRATTPGVWEQMLKPSPGERDTWTVLGLVKFTGEGGGPGRASGPRLRPLAGFGALPTGQGLYSPPQPAIGVLVAGREPIPAGLALEAFSDLTCQTGSQPWWLGGPLGCRCPAGRGHHGPPQGGAGVCT